MQISLNIFADSREDFKAQLLALADAVPDTTFGQPCRGFSLSVSPEYPDPRAGLAGAMTNYYAPAGVSGAAQEAQTVPDPDDVQTADLTPPGNTATSTGRVRASRAKNNTSRAEAPPAPTGPDADEPEAPEADADPFAGNEPEEAPKTLTPEQAKMAALEVLREVYALPGGPKAVKAVQTEFNVTKFVEVPDGQGPRLHARALDVKASLAT